MFGTDDDGSDGESFAGPWFGGVCVLVVAVLLALLMNHVQLSNRHRIASHCIDVLRRHFGRI
jgi:hypothetical protein